MEEAKYILHISASPQKEEKSFSKRLANVFLEECAKKFPDVNVLHRDLAKFPIPHLDEDNICAEYLPETEFTPEMKQKLEFRLALIHEIVNATAIVISTPKYNWNIPSSLKAYIDQIILEGKLDGENHQQLSGKPVTVLLATGGGNRPQDDFPIKYLQHTFSSLGSTDIQVIRTEFCLAGIIKGTENKIPRRDESYCRATYSVRKRVDEMVLV